MGFDFHSLSFVLMKKNLFLCLVISFVACCAIAQSKGALNLSLGPAIPLGEFASKNASSATSGLADIGAAAALAYQHPINHSRFGWTASLRGRFNPVSKSATLAPFEAQFPGHQWSMNDCHWISASALLGGTYKWPLSPKLSAHGTLGIGVAECWSPKQNITGIRDSAGFGAIDRLQATLPSVRATTFTALAGIGLSYRCCSHWSFTARADYQWLKPTFRNINPQLVWYQYGTVPGNLSLSNAASLYDFAATHDYTQPMSNVDMAVGVTRIW